MYITFPVATAPNVVGVQKILDGIRDVSKGTLKINLHLGGSLPIKAETITQSVSDNVVQMGDDAFFQVMSQSEACCGFRCSFTTTMSS